MRLFSLTVTLLASFLVSAVAFGADIEVKMLNKGEEGKMIFEPSFIKAQVGDNIIFLPTDKGHMAASIKGLIPEGAKKFYMFVLSLASLRSGFGSDPCDSLWFRFGVA